MRKFHVAAFTVAASLGLARADAQTVSFQTGTAINSPQLTSSGTTGSRMTGMSILWTFVGGGGGSGSWGDLTGGFHGVSSGGFQIQLLSSGNTVRGNNWTISNTSNSVLGSVTLNGAPGRTLFDCAWNDNTRACEAPGQPFFASGNGSAGSSAGWSAQSNGGTFTGAVSFVYSNLVGLNAAPVGDLFEQLSISFGANGMGTDQSYRFLADTDNSRFDAPPPSSTVPEPSTYAMLAAGLVGLFAVKRRRQLAA